MLFAIDIGNTNIDLGLFDQNQLVVQKTISRYAVNKTYHEKSVNSFIVKNTKRKTIKRALISSVVRDLGTKFIRYCTSNNISAQQVDTNWDLGLAISYNPPEHVGIDRLLSATAAFDMAPSKHSVIIADAGTAITVDIVDSFGTFLGGSITPGLNLMNQALKSGTSLLTNVELEKAPLLPATNTPEGIRSGILYGAASAIEGIGLRLAETVSTPSWFVITGGDGLMLFPHLKKYKKYVPNLVLYGLAKVWERQH